jgi:hypothetical protein
MSQASSINSIRPANDGSGAAEPGYCKVKMDKDASRGPDQCQHNELLGDSIAQSTQRTSTQLLQPPRLQAPPRATHPTAPAWPRPEPHRARPPQAPQRRRARRRRRPRHRLRLIAPCS